MSTSKTVACPFGGGGGGAFGFASASAELYGQRASFDLLGGLDADAYACASFERLTGVAQAHLDAREVTPSMLREMFGERAPFCVFSSPPCKGSSKLLSSKKAKEAKYQALNQLALVHTRTMLDAWPGSPPAFLIFENVPNVTTRAKAMVADLKRLLASAGYVLQDGFHECRHVGNLAQRRKRWFLVARNPDKVSAFLYYPPRRPGRVCGDVLTELPTPNDPAGGAMHRLPEISALNWWRLWAIPAGGDWRDLIADGVPRRERFRRHRVEAWAEPSVTIGGSGSNGPCGVADPRPRFHHVDRVARWDEPTGTVTHAPAPSSGAIAVADPRQGALAMGLNLGASAHHNLYRVHPAGEPSGTVTGARRPGQGAPSYAQPLDLSPQAGNPGLHYGKYVVVPWAGAAKTVAGSTRVGSGAQSVAQPLGAEWFRGVLGVLAPGDEAGTVTGNARPQSGAFSYAAPLPLVPEKACYPKGYAVLSPGQPSHTVAGISSVGCGTYSYADDLPTPLDLAPACSPRAGAYGVVSTSEPSPTVTGSAQVDNSAAALADPRPAPAFVALGYEEAKRVADGEIAVPFAIVDPARRGEALAIVDDLKRPPYRWAGEGKARRKVAVPLVLVSADGTWHRPLTTLELAVLQGLPWRHKGAPLDFGGGSTKARELIGNMVPPPVGTAIAEQMLLAGLAADAGAFFLTNGGGGVWVTPAQRRALERLGVRRVRPGDAAKVAGEFVLLDDRARRVRSKRKGPAFEAVMAAVRDEAAARAAERMGA